MKKRFKISFHLMYAGWMLFMLTLLMVHINPDYHTLRDVLFYSGFIVCLFGTASFLLLNQDVEFFQSMDEIKELKRDLKIEKQKTLWLNKILENQLKEEYGKD
jgi:hypothetical protein